MSTSNSNVLVGAATVSIGDYVTAGGTQTTMTDVGHTKGPVTLNATMEVFEAKSERAFGAIKVVPLDMKIVVKVPALEIRHDILRVAMKQAASQTTGTAPNLTTGIGLMSEQYHQVTIVGPGLGTNSVRTITLYRCEIKIAGDMPIAKGDTQVVELEINALYDDSITSPATVKFGKIVDS